MIEAIQNWIEHTYRLAPQKPVKRFLIDHATVLRYLGENHPLSRAEEVVLVTGSGKDFQLGLFLNPALFERTGEETPEHQTHRWLTATEGISHLILMAHKLKEGNPVSQLELELQAEIDKFLFAKLGFPESRSLLPCYHLEKEPNLTDLNTTQLHTYETARRLAARYCHRLEREYLCGRSFDGLFEELREFYRMNHWKKLKALGIP